MLLYFGHYVCYCPSDYQYCCCHSCNLCVYITSHTPSLLPLRCTLPLSLLLSLFNSTHSHKARVMPSPTSILIILPSPLSLDPPVLLPFPSPVIPALPPPPASTCSPALPSVPCTHLSPRLSPCPPAPCTHLFPCPSRRSLHPPVPAPFPPPPPPLQRVSSYSST